MADTNIPKDVASSFTSIFTNINFERLSEIAVALIL
ncbi:MAG: mechanosensitive ion channel family protein, partial [Acinetobacter junii]